MQYQFANGQVREFHNEKFRQTTIVSPQCNRGTPPRNMTMRDYVSVPVLSTHGEWNLGDMLSKVSIVNLWTAYNAMEARQSAHSRTVRAPKKAHRA